MNNLFLTVLKRKWSTVCAIVMNCENWAQVFLSRLLPGSYQGAVRLKFGVVIEWICERVNELPEKVQIVAAYHPWCPMTPQQSLVCLNNAGFSASMVTRFGELYLVATRNWE
jgi:hypothetical protein